MGIIIGLVSLALIFALIVKGLHFHMSLYKRGGGHQRSDLRKVSQKRKFHPRHHNDRLHEMIFHPAV